MTLSRISALTTLLWIPASLAGCGGGTQMPNSAPAVATAAQTDSAPPGDRQGCQDEDGVKVMPCRVKFDANHAASKTVRVTTGDNDRDRVKERDDCATRNIATIAQKTNHRYTVAAGTAGGQCTARFVRAGHDRDRDDGRNQGAELEIVNAM